MSLLHMTLHAAKIHQLFLYNLTYLVTFFYNNIALLLNTHFKCKKIHVKAVLLDLFVVDFAKK